MCHFLIIDKGEPHRRGDMVQLHPGDNLIGRYWKMDKPDIAFDSLYVSRKHASIKWNGEGFVLTDLKSKHGTQLDDAELVAGRDYELTSGARISLARGMVTMVYRIGADFDRTITLHNVFGEYSDTVSVDPDRREVRLDGVVLNFSGKEMDLLLLLYRNKNKAVSYDQIKTEIWPERRLVNDAVPDVGNEEINAVVYRLRKRLGKHGHKVVTVARYGVLLEL